MFEVYNQKPPLGAQINWGHPLSKNLVGCWLLNEGSGNRVINIARQTPTISSGNFVWASSPKGRVLVYPSAYAESSIGLLAAPFTILCWSMVYDLDGQRNIAVQDNWVLRWSTGKVHFRVYHGYWDYNSGNTVVDPYTWHQMGAICTSPVLYNHLILDGKIDRTIGLGGSLPSSSALIQLIADGSYGRLANLFIWGRALSPSELQSLYINPYQFLYRPSSKAYDVISTGNQPAAGVGYNWSVGSGSVSQKNPVTSISYDWSVATGGATQKQPVTSSGYTWSVGNGAVILPASGVGYNWSAGSGSVSQTAPVTSIGYDWSVGAGDAGVLEQEPAAGVGFTWSVGSGSVTQVQPITGSGFTWSVGTGALLRARSYGIYDSTNKWFSIYIEGTEVARIKSNGDLDLNGVVNINAF